MSRKRLGSRIVYSGAALVVAALFALFGVTMRLELGCVANCICLAAAAVGALFIMPIGVALSSPRAGPENAIWVTVRTRGE